MEDLRDEEIYLEELNLDVYIPQKLDRILDFNTAKKVNGDCMPA